MKPLIGNSPLSFKVLKRLIDSGYYSGEINNNRFELLQNRTSNTLQIIGILDNDNNFSLTCKRIYNMETAGKLAIGLCLFFSILSAINGNWVLSLALGISGIIVLLINRRTKQLELETFLDNYLRIWKEIEHK